MPEVVLGVGILISGVSLYFMACPDRLRLVLDAVFDSRWLYGVALLRLLVGAALIASAASVGYSALVELFGWLFALAGLALLVIPGPLLRRLLGWYTDLSAAMTRIWLGGALLFGLFFIYAWAV